MSEKRLAKMGKIYLGRPIEVKDRKELIATLKPNMLKHMRADNGDLPEGHMPEAKAVSAPAFA